MRQGPENSSVHRTSSPGGGCDFIKADDDSLSPEHIVWTEQAFPRVLRATKLSDPAAPTPQAAQLSRLGGARIWTETDRHRVVWPAASGSHRLIADASPDVDALILPLDEAFETRLDAARRFWRALNGRPSRQAYGSLPHETKLRHILNLRAHDGRRAGVTYRAIAEALLSTETIPPRDWRDHPLRHKVRAILRRTDRLIAGGYRDLLSYPHGRGRQDGR